MNTQMGFYRDVARKACRKLDRLLNAIEKDRHNRSRGHNNDVGLAKAYENAENFLNDFEWENL